MHCVGFTRIIWWIGKSKDLRFKLSGKHHAFFVCVKLINYGAFIINS